MFGGAIAGMLPVRLGGTPQEGVTAAQHARLVADWYAVRQTVPLAHIAWTVSGSVATVTYYCGLNGSGLAYAPDHVTIGELSANQLIFAWETPAFTDPYGVTYPFRARHGIAQATGTSFRSSNVLGSSGDADGIAVYQYNASGTIVAPTDGFVVIW